MIFSLIFYLFGSSLLLTCFSNFWNSQCKNPNYSTNRCMHRVIKKILNMFKVNNKDTKTTSLTSVLCTCVTLNMSHTYFKCLCCWLCTDKLSKCWKSKCMYKFVKKILSYKPIIWNCFVVTRNWTFSCSTSAYVNAKLWPVY